MPHVQQIQSEYQLNILQNNEHRNLYQNPVPEQIEVEILLLPREDGGDSADEIDWQRMDDLMNEAIQNLNSANETGQAANVPMEPRRSEREPPYSSRYLQYRGRLLDGN